MDRNEILNEMINAVEDQCTVQSLTQTKKGLQCCVVSYVQADGRRSAQERSQAWA